MIIQVFYKANEVHVFVVSSDDLSFKGSMTNPSVDSENESDISSFLIYEEYERTLEDY